MSQFRPCLVQHLPWISSHPIELVNKGKSRDLISPHLPIHSYGLTLNSTHTTQHKNRTIQNPQCPLHFYCKIHMPWRINDIYLVVIPGAVSGGGLDGDAFLSFQVHGIHLGAHAVAATNLVYFMDATGVVKDALGEGGLARVDVGGDTYVSEALYGFLPPWFLVFLSPREV
uniref:Elongation factor G n=1 Tax=Rhizophora mucronata TaxID=61149 RepID=A0A2P2LU99_RHIMU